jgi:hypothetical protein
MKKILRKKTIAVQLGDSFTFINKAQISNKFNPKARFNEIAYQDWFFVRESIASKSGKVTMTNYIDKRLRW